MRNNKAATSSLPKAPVRHLRAMLGYLKPYRLQVAAAMLALLFTSSAVLGMGGALRYLVDKGLSQGNELLLDQALLLLLGVVLVLAFATYARYYLVSWIGERVVADIRRDLYGHLMHMDVAFFETNRSGDLLSRLTTDTALLQSVFGSSISVALRNTLMLVGGISLLLTTSGRLTGIVGVLLLLTVLPIIILGRRVRQMSRETQTKVAEMNAHAEESLFAIRTIQAMSMEQSDARRFTGLVDTALATALSRIRTRAFLTGMVIFLVFGAVITVLWVGGKEVLRGAMSGGELSAFVFYAVVVASATGALSEVFAEIQRAAGASERIAELMKIAPGITAPAQALPVPELKQAALAFESVTFHYPSRPDKASLERIDLQVNPGETLALVGPSGAGKTTIFQLLLRFYDPASGSIRIGGNDIRDFDPRALRCHIGLVPQDPVIFSTTALANIRFGREAATVEEVREAARAANALEFIEKLPQGFDTYLGEKGVQLSGGQRQRLAIARAIIRNPGLLLLDEATSALDAENERLVQAALERLMEGRTTLVIAHRLSTVRGADRIVLLNEGKIEAVGNHRELMEKSPLYAHFVELQFQQGNEAA